MHYSDFNYKTRKTIRRSLAFLLAFLLAFTTADMTALAAETPISIEGASSADHEILVQKDAAGLTVDDEAVEASDTAKGKNDGESGSEPNIAPNTSDEDSKNSEMNDFEEAGDSDANGSGTDAGEEEADEEPGEEAGANAGDMTKDDADDPASDADDALAEDELAEDELAGEQLPTEILGDDYYEEAFFEDVEAEDSGILQAGSFLHFEAETLPLPALMPDAGSTPTKTFPDFVYGKLKSRTKTIDVTAYNVPKTSIKAQVAAVINDHPNLYFVKGNYRFSYNKAGIVCNLYMQYHADAASDMDFDEAVKKALAVTDSGMTDLEKALAIHDYLVLNCEYDYDNYLNHTIPWDSYTAEGCLVNRTAVCNGYALAYQYLMQKLGIPCDKVTSRSMNHAWNTVKIGSRYYHVDTTWDDPVSDMKGRVRHFYFMVSDDGMKSDRSHYGWEGGHSASDKSYDNYFWKNIDKQIIKSDGKYYYYDYSTDTIYCKSGLKGTQTVALKVSFPSDPDVTWWRYYAGFGGYKGKVYIADYQNVYLLKQSGSSHSLQKVATPGSSSACIYGLYEQDGDLKVLLRSSKGDSIKKVTMSGPLQSVSFDPTTLTVAYGEEAILTPVLSPAETTNTNVNRFTWTTSDPTIATVTSEGRVIPVSAGTCVITATNMDDTSCKATCKITVKAVTYTVKFYDKAGKVISTQKVGRARSASAPEAPAVKGYTFNKWNQAYDFVTKDLDIKPVYDPIQYHVTYNANYPAGSIAETQSGTMAAVTAQYDKSYKAAASAFSVARYSFAGWNTKADGTGRDYVPGSSSSGTFKNLTATDGETVTLYAKWKPKTYSITYSSNAGSIDSKPSGKVSGQTVSYYSGFTTKKNAFKATGYRFTGWNTKADGTGIAVGTGNGAEKIVSTGTAPAGVDDMAAANSNKLTLYAQWEPINYTIYFKRGSAKTPSGGYLTPANNEMTAGAVYGEGVESMEDAFGVAVRYGEQINLRGAEYTVPGFTLSGWKEADGKLLKNGNLKNLTARDGEKIVLTAQWTLAKYNVKYDLDGGKVSKANPSSYNYYSDLKAPNFPKKTGARFLGWSTKPKSRLTVGELTVLSQNAPNPQQVLIPAGSTGNVTLYAILEENTYKLSLSVNTKGEQYGASYSQSMSDEKGSYDPVKYTDTFTLQAAADAMNASVPEDRRGQVKVKSFNTKANGSGKTYALNKSYSKLASNHNARVTLYAIWGNASYKVNYVLNGGKNSTKNPKSFTFGSGSVLLQKPTRTGYRFDGWYTGYNPEAPEPYTGAVTGINCAQTSDVTLYAKWTPIMYSIRLDKNGKGVITDADKLAAAQALLKDLQYDVRGQELDLAQIPFSRSGYVLTGFNTKADGSGSAYKVSAETGKINFYNVSSKVGTLTLYAQWDVPRNRISYMNYTTEGALLSGVKNSSPVQYKTGTAAAVALKNPTCTGYTFQGWYTGYNPSTKAFSGKITQIPKGAKANYTLYGKWSENSYKLVMKSNGGVGGDTTVTMKYTQSRALDGSRGRKGYILAGWATTAKGKVKYAPSQTISKLSAKNNGTVTLYAVWTKVTVSKASITGMEIDRSSHALTLKYQSKDADLLRYEIYTSPHPAMREAYWIASTTTNTYQVDGYRAQRYYIVRGVKKDSLGNLIYGAWSDARTMLP